MIRFFPALIFSLTLTTWVFGENGAPWQGFASLTSSSERNEFVTGGRAGEVLVWNWRSGNVVCRWVIEGGLPVVGIEAGTEPLLWKCVTLDGRQWDLASGADPKLDPSSSEELETDRQLWLNHSPFFHKITLLDSGKTFEGGPDGRVTLQTVSVAGPIEWHAHSTAITGLALSPDRSVLLSISWDGELRLWNSDTGSALGGLP